MREMNKSVIDEFRANDGELSGPMQGAPILLLTTVGRCSGRAYTTPVGFIDVGGRLAIAAANGGADTNPDWFKNLQSNSDVTVELPGATVASRATVATGVERTDLLDRLAATLPGMPEHIAAANREIPVVVLEDSNNSTPGRT